MLKLKFLFLPLCAAIPLATQASVSKLDTLYESVKNIKSGIIITKATFKVSHLAFECANPNDLQKFKDAFISQQIRIMRAEEELIRCVVKNAYSPREKDQLPSDCTKMAEAFAGSSGFIRYNSFVSQFNEAMSELPSSLPPLPEKQTEKKQGMSTTKKVVIGGTAVVVTVGVALVSAPILFPGTIAAIKAKAIIVAIKAAGAKIAALSATTKATVVATVTETAGTLYKEAKGSFDRLPLSDKVATVAEVISRVEKAHAEAGSPSLFGSAEEEELKQLMRMREMGRSLADRIKETHFSPIKIN